MFQIVVDAFDEMLEIRDTIQAPILMFENEDKTCAKFMIPTDSKLLYLYEIKVVAGTKWGRYSGGWFSLDYANVTDMSTGTGSGTGSGTGTGSAETPIRTGTVSNSYVNVRNAAGTTGTTVGGQTVAGGTTTGGLLLLSLPLLPFTAVSWFPPL